MQWHEFDGPMTRLTSWFNRKLTHQQLDLWFEKVEFMPAIAWDELVSTVMDTARFFPIPADFSKAYSQWAENNPRVTRRYEREECAECQKRGYFNIWRSDGYAYLAPCKVCQNWRGFFPTKGKHTPAKFWTRAELLKAGWLLSDPFLTKNKNTVVPEEVSEENKSLYADVMGKLEQEKCKKRGRSA